MSAENLGIVAGILLSLIFSYVPGAADWFATLDANRKRLVMLGLLAATSIGIVGLACAGLSNTIVCDRPGILAIAQAFVLAAIANQTTYELSPKRQ